MKRVVIIILFFYSLWLKAEDNIILLDYPKALELCQSKQNDSLVGEITLSYYNWVYALHNYQLLSEKLSVFQAQKRISLIYYDVGETDHLDTLEASYYAAIAEMELLDAELLVSQSYQKLKHTLAIQEDFAPKTPLKIKFETESLRVKINTDERHILKTLENQLKLYEESGKVYQQSIDAYFQVNKKAEEISNREYYRARIQSLDLQIKYNNLVQQYNQIAINLAY